jgi:large subunit ribosomal protein L21
MFAVVRSGGKQFIVEKDRILRVPRIAAKKKAKLNFEVLLLADGKNIKIGEPVLKDAKCEAQVLEEVKGKKIEVLKYKPKKRYRKHYGFRPIYTRVQITKITG